MILVIVSHISLSGWDSRQDPDPEIFEIPDFIEFTNDL